METQDKISYITSVLSELSDGNYDVPCKVEGTGDVYDVIIEGINKLRVNLKESTVSKDFLSSIYDGIKDFLIILDQNCRILKINSEVERKIGYDEHELFGKEIEYILTEECQEQCVILKNSLNNTGFLHDFSIQFKSRDNKIIPTSAYSSILINSINNDKHVLLIAKDITSLKDVENKLIAKNKELDTFVYKSSHDLKGPLASIIGLTNIATMEVQDLTAVGYFEMIRNSAQRLDRILVDLSELARLRNTATKISKVNLTSLIDGVVESFMMESKLKLKINIIKNIVNVHDFYSNDKILLSIIQNLIGNAIKYRRVSNRNEPYILIEVMKVENEIKIVVKDNGLGIRTDKIPKIFGMFERATMAGDGTGLGLYIVKTSLEKLSGRIEVESEEGKGSVFTVYLPSLEDKENIEIN